MMLVPLMIVKALLLSLAPVPAASPWQLVNEPTEIANFQLDHAAPHAGAASARLTVVKSAGHEIALLQPFRAETWRGKRVLLTGWVRTDLAAGEAGLTIILNNGGRKNIYYPTDQRLTKKTEWQRLSVVCDVPPDTSLLSIGVWVRHGSGSVWLDDVTFGVSGGNAGNPPEPRPSQTLTHDEMSRIADAYKRAPAVPSDLDFEQP